MEKITLDFSNCKRWYEVYDEIITKCELPEWCGKNLDGLWDFMEDDFVLWNEPALITIIGTQKMSEEAKDTFMDINKMVFEHVHKAAPNVKFEIISQEKTNKKDVHF